MSNLKVCSTSELAFVIGVAKEKFNGPIGVYQSIAIPVDDLILLLSKVLSKSTPHKFATSRNKVKSRFCTSGRSFGKFVDRFSIEA